jgi:hypothetical protein
MTRAILLLILATTAASAEPLPVPKPPGQQCPAGAHYWCTPMPGSKLQAVPKPRGTSCPSGWRESGGTCVAPDRRAW